MKKMFKKTTIPFLKSNIIWIGTKSQWIKKYSKNKKRLPLLKMKPRGLIRMGQNSFLNTNGMKNFIPKLRPKPFVGRSNGKNDSFEIFFTKISLVRVFWRTRPQTATFFLVITDTLCMHPPNFCNLHKCWRELSLKSYDSRKFNLRWHCFSKPVVLKCFSYMLGIKRTTHDRKNEPSLSNDST